MFHICNTRTVRAALGAALLTLVAACSDAPSGLRQPLPLPGPLSDELASELPSIRGVLETPTVALQPGERRLQRVRRSPDGHVYTFVSAARPSEAPRELLVLRDGQPMLHTINAWRHTAGGDVLERQQGMVFSAGEAPRYFDSHAQGVATAAGGEPVVMAHSAMTRATTDALGSESADRRSRGRNQEQFVCEAEVRALDAAMDSYVGAVVTYVVAYATGNPWVVLTAGSNLFNSFRAFERAAAAVTQCIDGAQPVLKPAEM